MQFILFANDTSFLLHSHIHWTWSIKQTFTWPCLVLTLQHWIVICFTICLLHQTECLHSCYGQDEICKTSLLHYTASMTFGSAPRTYRAFWTQCPMHSFIQQYLNIEYLHKKYKLSYKKYNPSQINSSKKKFWMFSYPFMLLCFIEFHRCYRSYSEGKTLHQQKN